MKNLSIDWFDFVVVIVLVLGFFRGRKNGMSNEFLPVMQWLLMILAAGYLYAPLAGVLSSVAATLGFSLLFWYLFSYLLIVIVIKTIFVLIKKAVGEKLVGSDLFGRAEFYFGMLAGILRFACIIVMVFALLNAVPLPAEAKVAEEQKKQKESLGSNFFPPPDEIRLDILARSFTSKLIKTYLGNVLITPTVGKSTPLEKREGPGQKLGREIDEVIGTKTNK